MDEPQLITKTLAGNPHSFQPLIERYQAGVVIYCQRFVGDHHTAEDIAQEAFLRAYQQLASFDPQKGRFSTWLYKIASHKAIDYLRKHRHQVDIADLEILADDAPPDELAFDEIAALHQAIDTLEPPIFAHVIKAYYWEGKSYQAIAEEYQTTTNTIGTWMRRAKQQLKERLS